MGIIETPQQAQLAEVDLAAAVPPVMPAQMRAVVTPGPDGQQVVALQITSIGCRTTVVLGAEDAQVWAAKLADAARQARTGLIVPAGQG